VTSHDFSSATRTKNDRNRTALRNPTDSQRPGAPRHGV